MLAVTIVAMLLGMGIMLFRPKPLWIYKGQLHNVIEKADRIVIREGIFFRNEIDKDRVFFEVTDPSKIKEVFDNLQFEVEQFQEGVCACRGYPEIDWYSGQQPIAQTDFHHDPGESIRWDGFRGDAVLTKKSSEWLAKWLKLQGVDTSKIQ